MTQPEQNASLNYEEILKKPAFNSLEPERKEMMLELMRKLEGKGSMEALAILSDFAKKMPRGQELSRETQDMMIEALFETMPESDKARFKSIMKVMESFQKS